MQEIFFEVLNRSISAGWLVLVIVLLRPLLKKAPKWTVCILWGLVAIRLLSPYSIESIVSLIPSSETVSPSIVYAQRPTIHTGIGFINRTVNPVISQSLAPAQPSSINPLQVYAFIGTILWSAGTIIMLLYAAISAIRLRHRVSAALPVDDHVWICDGIPSAFILGFIKPRIYLPSHLSACEQEYVLAHEKAHLKRKDHWWKPFGYLLLSFTWFHPLMWLAYVLLCRDIEVACDEKVVGNFTSSEKKAYSIALLNCSVSKRTISACPLAFGEIGVKSRIKRVLSFKKSALWVTIAAVLVCGVTAACFLTNPKEDNSSLSSPFDKTYSGGEIVYMVSEVMYDAPQYSFIYTPEAAPYYRLTEDMKLEVCEDKQSGSWLTPGTLEPFELTEKNFTDLCTPFDMETPELLTSILHENARSWELTVLYSDNGTFYYLLQQNDGSLYLCLGYHRADRDLIRWIFRLSETKLDSTVTTAADTVEKTPEATASKEDLLEIAVRNAIIDNNHTNHTDQYFACESHILLDEVTAIACGSDEQSSYENTTLYMMVLYQEYDLSEGYIKLCAGSHMPVAITLQWKNGQYTLLEYWTPQDGDYYLSSIQGKFPENCWDLAANTQMHILSQTQHCYDRAVRYANLDTEEILNDLYEQIERSPAESSNPGDYIDAHSIAYREITYYGIHTLKHAFHEFLKGEQIGLRGHLMALSCQYIMKNMGEPFTAAEYMTGQDWFDQFKEYALSLKPEIVSPFSSQFRPVVRLLLDMV